MDDKDSDHIVNPPLIGVRDEDALCPPITSVDDYMKWLKENREALKRFFGFDLAKERAEEASPPPSASDPDAG
jgi:hypothetical protein